eukprot:m.792531 g.792531  ORF g.792531 m.792531 type:complete len:314 (-) comp59222_c0_seq6:813-1754(-)
MLLALHERVVLLLQARTQRSLLGRGMILQFRGLLMIGRRRIAKVSQHCIGRFALLQKSGFFNIKAFLQVLHKLGLQVCYQDDDALEVLEGRNRSCGNHPIPCFTKVLQPRSDDLVLESQGTQRRLATLLGGICEGVDRKAESFLTDRLISGDRDDCCAFRQKFVSFVASLGEIELQAVDLLMQFFAPLLAIMSIICIRSHALEIAELVEKSLLDEFLQFVFLVAELGQQLLLGSVCNHQAWGCLENNPGTLQLFLELLDLLGQGFLDRELRLEVQCGGVKEDLQEDVLATGANDRTEVVGQALADFLSRGLGL